MKYKVIGVYTSEDARDGRGARVWESILSHVRSLGIAARVIVYRGTAGCYENGELASNKIEVLSFNMPIKLEIILPARELEGVLPVVEEIAKDGIVSIEDTEVIAHRAEKRLIPRQIRVKDVMTESTETILETTPVNDVIRLLLHSPFNALPVVDQSGHPIGIVTQGDLMNRAQMPVRLGLLSQMESHKVEDYLESVSKQRAGDIMSTPLVTINLDQRLTDAVEAMLGRHLKRLPVVDSQGRLVGILSRSDIFHTITTETPDWEAIRKQCEIIDIDRAVYVRDIARRDMLTVSPDTSIDEVVRIIDSNDIQRVAVVDPENRLLGIIADSDLLGLFSDHRSLFWDYIVQRLPATEMARRHEDIVRITNARKAADAMKTNIITVREDTTIEEAIRLMADRQIKRLPVVDETGRFKGMISRDSLLRAGTTS